MENSRPNHLIRETEVEERNYKNRGEHVFNTLKREILTLKLKPGQFISEKEICLRFDVSRTPVREALRRLQEQGFVRAIPYSGTQVSLLNLQNIREMIYMRMAVEWMILRDFIKIATPILHEEIRHQIKLQELMIQEPDFEPEIFYKMDSRLHAIWFDATGKHFLLEFIQGQQVHYSRFRRLKFAMETDYLRIVKEHALLFEKICACDEHGIECVLRNHLSVGLECVGQIIDSEYNIYFEKERPI